MSEFIAVIPARGGSKGLLNKNLRRVQGMSLVARAVMLARAVPEIGRVVVSTDSRTIAEAASEAGAEVPFMRPPELAQDSTPMVAVLQHLIARLGDGFDGLVLLQPTSPMRRLDHIRAAIGLYERERVPPDPVACVHTISPLPCEFGPGKWLRIGRDGRLTPMGHEAQGALCYRNGAAVVLDPKRLTALNLGNGRAVACTLEEGLITIDSFEDLLWIEYCGRVLEPVP